MPRNTREVDLFLKSTPSTRNHAFVYRRVRGIFLPDNQYVVCATSASLLSTFAGYPVGHLLMNEFTTTVLPNFAARFLEKQVTSQQSAHHYPSSCCYHFQGGRYWGYVLSSFHRPRVGPVIRAFGTYNTHCLPQASTEAF